MPIYEFKCQCGNEVDLMLPVDDRNKAQKCPECKKSMERQTTSGGFWIKNWNGRGRCE